MFGGPSLSNPPFPVVAFGFFFGVCVFFYTHPRKLEGRAVDRGFISNLAAASDSLMTTSVPFKAALIKRYFFPAAPAGPLD